MKRNPHLRVVLPLASFLPNGRPSLLNTVPCTLSSAWDTGTGTGHFLILGCKLTLRRRKADSPANTTQTVQGAGSGLAQLRLAGALLPRKLPDPTQQASPELNPGGQRKMQKP